MDKLVGKLISRFLLVLVTVLVANLFIGGFAQAGKRVALVIGNSEYQNTSPLKNPVNDANLMTSSLRGSGFEVTKILNADFKTMKRAMLDFGRDLRNSPEAGLFYYAGHGVQVRGENYLIPVNAQISDEDEVDLEAININSFLRVMNSSSSAINIVVLDACRNNPFARSFRSVSRGLAPVDAPKGTYIAYATAPGDVAADGKGDNSPYSVALAKAIKQGGITIEQVFKQARKSVLETTDAKQVPWETSSITGNFFFREREEVVEKPPVIEKPIITKPIINNNSQARNEAENVYKQIKDSKNVEVLEIFAKQFPDSIYTKFIQVRIKTLKQANLQNDKPPKENDANDNNYNSVNLAEIMTKAEAAYDKQNYKEAARLFTIATDKGQGRAAFFLGYQYDKGLGVKQDFLEAARIYKIAADQNQAGAIVNLGLLYDNGQGVSQDYNEAARLYKKAVALNESNAMYKLGRLHNSGLGVRLDQVAAAELLFNSIKSGYAFALTEMTANSSVWGAEFRRELQRKMKLEGYYNGAIDGDFGSGTVRALKSIVQ